MVTESKHPEFMVGLIALVFASLLIRTANCQWDDKKEVLAKVEKTFGDPPGMTRVRRDARIWADAKKRMVVVDGYIALRVGQLEMFACPAGTKEHESVVGLFTKAYYVHASLLAIGAKVGAPVQWEPEYKAATGSEIKITVLWVDDQGKKKSADARSMIRELGTNKTMESNWVFAGSSMYKDPDTGEQRYLAESGDLVCVSNFATATLDVPHKSSQVNSGLMYLANTELIPPEETPVRLVFQIVESASASTKSTDASKASIADAFGSPASGQKKMPVIKDQPKTSSPQKSDAKAGHKSQ